jgi:hypothetical protein
MLKVVTEPLDGRFHHNVIPPAWALDGQPVDGLQGSHLRTIAIATAQHVLLGDGLPYPRDAELPQRSLDSGDAQRAQRSITVRDVLPLDDFGSVRLPLESRYEVVHGLVERALIVLHTDAVHPEGCLLADIPPALVETRLVAPLIAVAEPMLGLLLGLLRDPRQEG